MPDESLPFDHSKLSERDQEILRAFLATNDFETLPLDSEDATQPLTPPQSIDPTVDLEDEMLVVFATEVNEDLGTLREGLEQAERDEDIASPGFLILRQMGHKIRGSAAMIGCDAMSTIAHYIEIVVHQVASGEISVHTGLYACGHAVGAIETTLESVIVQKHEDLLPLLGLEQDLKALGISLAEPDEDEEVRTALAGLVGEDGEARAGTEPPVPTLYEIQSQSVQGTGGPRGRPGFAAFDQLIQHTERLIEQQTALEDARKQVNIAFQELQTAQARLRRLEAFFSSIFLSSPGASIDTADEGLVPSSSLVARILREAPARGGRVYASQSNAQSLSLEDAARWDELELDRFSETNLLEYALNEAISDITTATAQLQHALAHLDTLMAQHIATTKQVRAGYVQYFPQATRLEQGLLVRAWEQQVIIPFTQVLRIDYQGQNSYDHFYTLNDLLGFPTVSPAATSISSPPLSRVQVVLRLSLDSVLPAQVGVQVDEVIGQIELLSKQPPIPLQRPGITGMAIDSADNVLLVLDLSALIRQAQSRQGQQRIVSEQRQAYETAHSTTRDRPKILIVDDSVSIRRTIRQTLKQKDYVILEAGNGREALEKIEQELPDVLFLDLEMPEMNGYEVLNILRTRSLLPNLKIALLTSRTSDKHRQRARELGAHRYLTKPCAENALLETVETLLAQ